MKAAAALAVERMERAVVVVDSMKCAESIAEWPVLKRGLVQEQFWRLAGTEASREAGDGWQWQAAVQEKARTLETQ